MDINDAIDILGEMSDNDLYAEGIVSGRDDREVTLMCGDNPVMSIRFRTAEVRIFDFDHLPFVLQGMYKSQGEVLAMDALDRKLKFITWLSNRVLLLSRTNAKKLLMGIGVDQSNDPMTRAKIAMICRAVSILDNYWLYIEGEAVMWKHVNLRRNSLSDVVAQVALHGKSLSLQGSLITPELTTLGAYAKAWRRYPDGSLWLHKAGHKGDEESRVEVTVSNILDKTSAVHVPYIGREDDGVYVCACPAITSDNLSIVSSSDLALSSYYSGRKIVKHIKDLDEESTYVMYIVDYLISNTDRHAGNWGFMYDPDTMDIGKCHPLFDHNKAFDKDVMSEDDFVVDRKGTSAKEVAKYAIKHVDFHLTKEVTQLDFMNGQQYRSFMRRLRELDVKTVPETPMQMAERLVRFSCLCRNRYEMVDEVISCLPRVGSEFDDKQVAEVVQITCEHVLPKIIVNK